MLFADTPNGNTALLVCLIAVVIYCFWPKDEDWDDDDDDDHINYEPILNIGDL